jgi:hypothetical protein
MYIYIYIYTFLVVSHHEKSPLKEGNGRKEGRNGRRRKRKGGRKE